ncbi:MULTISPECIES: hypothetical protein [Acinetobacter Taxon 24D]|uniref:hypothetical protein n=1 Tax=Acinetobacter Taxon 24D TaxID=2839057 RepID=UPI00103883C9|nr:MULTISPECIES: hypothetical protein [Acinetobacter Taxon 24D]NNG82855.1 hypothetical protein [Acinetobacter sp. ANC 5378]TCH64480.1 hypothetical protein E0409_05605 [Acinetobacter sp. ANC 4862]
MLVLEEIYRSRKNEYSTSFNLRIQRSLSWFKKALVLHDDLDMQFIMEWVAFNALYAREQAANQQQQTLRLFLSSMYHKDADQKIFRILWEKKQPTIRLLLSNPYLDQSFWDWRNQKISEETWRSAFDTEQQQLQQILQNHDSVSLLVSLFSRLATLHQQLSQGGATYNSALNRKQLANACSVLSVLVPSFIQILLENVENIEFSKPFYPVAQMS